jgi:hypothetical protein
LESPDGEYLYYYKFKHSDGGGSPGPLFRMPVRGGPETQVLPRVADWHAFAVAAKAIYFTPDVKSLQRLDLSSGKVSTLATTGEFVDNLCVSPDEAYVVWAQVKPIVLVSAELMLVEGFR